jgi:hypothetical protein
MDSLLTLKNALVKLYNGRYILYLSLNSIIIFIISEEESDCFMINMFTTEEFTSQSQNNQNEKLNSGFIFLQTNC